MLCLAWAVSHLDRAYECARAQEPALPEYQLKAVFLCNFAKFIEWPTGAFAGPDDPIIIGVMGENPFDDYLKQAVKGKMVGNRSFVTKHVRLSAEARKCHILFIANSEWRRLREIMNGLSGASVLTVSDLDHFLEAGGIIRFYMEGKKVRFETNSEMAKHSQLKISSKLLKLGKGESEDGK
jgi:YfiR/HmsC-like